MRHISLGSPGGNRESLAGWPFYASFAYTGTGSEMHELLLMRHAKSSWKEEGRSDHERSLNQRGLRDAPRMGRLLVELDLSPSLVISSDATRAVMTAKLVCEAIEGRPEVITTPRLYLAAAETYLGVLHDLAGEHTRVMMIGHNPGMEVLASALAQEQTPMPTAALTYCEIHAERWSSFCESRSWEAAAATVSQFSVWRPKELTTDQEDAP